MRSAFTRGSPRIKANSGSVSARPIRNGPADEPQKGTEPIVASEGRPAGIFSDLFRTVPDKLATAGFLRLYPVLVKTSIEFAHVLSIGYRCRLPLGYSSLLAFPAEQMHLLGMRILLALLASTRVAAGCCGQIFGTWKGKNLIVRFEPHAKGEVFTVERIEADGRTTSCSTILYVDGALRDLQDFDCSGTQSSRRVDRRTVEIVRTCGNGVWTRFVRSELVLETTEHPDDGRAERRGSSTLNALGYLKRAELFHPAKVAPAPVLYSLTGSSQAAILHAGTNRVASASDPALTGEALEIYAASLLDGSAISPQVAIRGRMAEVLFFGNAPGFSGLNQIDIRVPASIASGTTVPVRINYLGRASNEVTLAVQ